jgi:hypothetical protein
MPPFLPDAASYPMLRDWRQWWSGMVVFWRGKDANSNSGEE